MKEYLGGGDRLSKITVIRAEAQKCSPNFYPSVGSWNADILDLYLSIYLFIYLFIIYLSLTTLGS